MQHNYPGTKVPASTEYLRHVAPKRMGNLWWKERMAK